MTPGVESINRPTFATSVCTADLRCWRPHAAMTRGDISFRVAVVRTIASVLSSRNDVVWRPKISASSTRILTHTNTENCEGVVPPEPTILCRLKTLGPIILPSRMVQANESIAKGKFDGLVPAATAASGRVGRVCLFVRAVLSRSRRKFHYISVQSMGNLQPWARTFYIHALFLSRFLIFAPTDYTANATWYNIFLGVHGGS